MKRLYYLDKLGWPVETIKGRWFQNFLRRLIHTRRVTFKKLYCLMTPAEKSREKFENILLSSDDINDLLVECCTHHYDHLIEGILPDIRFATAVAMQKSHTESLEAAAPYDFLQREPNKVTRETIEKSERGEGVKSVDTVEEMFEDLDN